MHTTTVVQVLKYVWQTGIGRGWPMTAAEEAAFTRGLPNPDGAPATRYALTTAMLLVREGGDADSAARIGVHPDWREVAASWAHLHACFTAARTAWEHIIGEPGEHAAAFIELAEQASHIAPVPVRRLADAATGGHRTVEMAAAGIAARTMRVSSEVSAMEAALSRSPSVVAARIGAALYDPYTDSSLWADPYFVPTRPGQLTPLRLAALLEGDALPESDEYDL